MTKESSNLGRAEKILLFLYDFAEGRRDKIRYEDIVVGLFKKYPNDFHLKGYMEYPDSGDLIHKPLYDFKKKGYLNAESKIFSLTERGAEYAEQLKHKGTAAGATASSRLSRSTETEVSRVKSLEGFLLFVNNESEKLSDNDFYNYLGVTVRTQKNAFIGRLETMNAVVAELKRDKDEGSKASIVAYHDFLVSKHQATINYFMKN